MRLMILASLVLSLGACQGPHIDDTANQQNPNDLNYVQGPYGYSQYAVIANLRFIGKSDPDGASGAADYANLTMAPITLNDYHQDPNVKLLVVSGVARWCGPCNAEQPSVVQASLDYYSKGVRFLEAVIEGSRPGVASTETDINRWQETHDLHIGLVIDPNDYIHQYADIAAFPLNMIISTNDMRIQYMQVGEVDIGAVVANYVQ